MLTASASMAQRSQQNWEKKRSLTAASINNSGGLRPPSELQSPWRLRLYGGAPSAAKYRANGPPNNYNAKNDANDDGSASSIIVAKNNSNENNGNGHQFNSTSGKMYLSPKMMISIKREIEALPLPATLASVATALLNSTIIWDAYNVNDYDENNEQAAQNSGDVDDYLAKYLSGITIDAEQNSLQDAKLQFQSLCREMITKGNHAMLSTWEEVLDKLGEEFSFLKGALVTDDEESALEEEAGSSVDEDNAVVLYEGAKISIKVSMATPMSKRRRGKESPKKSHPTFAKPTQRRTSIKLKHVLQRATKGVIKGAKQKIDMGLDLYRQKLLDKMGKAKYNEMFQQATVSPAKDLHILDDAAKRLDDQIEQLEASRRKTKQDELLEKAELERQARESASKLLRPLTPEEAQIVKNAIYGIGRPDEILASQDADSVQRESMHRLQPGQWLNDEVINYFLKNCLAKRDEKLCAKQAGRKRSHFFNSFFVQTMFDEKNSNPSLRGKYNYKNVRRWSKKVPGKDVFNLKYIFCPINLDNMHWTSACIFMEEKKIQYYDSMGGTDWSKLKGLLEYLKDEWRAKKGGEMDTSEWELVGCQPSTPRQTNGFDCGVFTCMFADFVTKDCEPVFNQTHITQCRQRIALSIMKNCAIE